MAGIAGGIQQGVIRLPASLDVGSRLRHQRREDRLRRSLVMPIQSGDLLHGTWQQVVLVDFDNRPRNRSWTATIMGE